MVPGVFASVIFALPPTVRMTNLGIRQISRELVEASDSFGGTGWQKLIKLELPLAKALFGWGQTNHDAGIINGRDRVNDRCSWVRARRLVRLATSTSR